MRRIRKALPWLLLVACGGARATTKANIDPLPVSAPCAEKDDYQCSSDGARVLRCDGARWSVAGECAGPTHCVSTSNKIKCDDSLASAGTACAVEGNQSCALDKSMLLTCKGGVMTETRHCRGAGSCTLRAGTPTCDTTIAEVGDRCGADDEGACTPDHRAYVACRNHVMVERSACNCSVDGTTIVCR